jgi:hypothetical protein
MARGTTLNELRDMLRAEIGASSNVAMGVNTTNQYDQIIRRVQERLWAEHNWDFGYIKRDEELIAGERYYAFDSEIDFDRIVSAYVKWDEKWQPVNYGISTAEYNANDSDIGEVNDPVVRWRHHEDNQFEVWPIPASNGSILRFEAIKKLPALISPSDVAVLDDNLIVLFAAAELLARSKAADANSKLAQATTLLSRLKGNALKNDRFIYGGAISRGDRLRYIGGRAVRDDR